MSSVRSQKDGRLFFDFYFEGVRCRELSPLKDAPANRRQMKKAMAKIDSEFELGTFIYERSFAAKLLPTFSEFSSKRRLLTVQHSVI